MKVFESCGKEGWLEVCIDGGEVICLNFKVKVTVSVGYTHQTEESFGEESDEFIEIENQGEGDAEHLFSNPPENNMVSHNKDFAKRKKCLKENKKSSSLSHHGTENDTGKSSHSNIKTRPLSDVLKQLPSSTGGSERNKSPTSSWNATASVTNIQDSGLPQVDRKKTRAQASTGKVRAKKVLSESLAKKLQQLPLEKSSHQMLKKKKIRSSRDQTSPHISTSIVLPSAEKSEGEHCSIEGVHSPQPGPGSLRSSNSKSSSNSRKTFSWKKIWKCHFCEKVFRSKGDYIGHKKPSRLSQLCKECGYCSPSKALYLIHQYQKHTNTNNDRYTVTNKDLRCHICEEPVALNETLYHIMIKHTGENPYECCVCKAPAKYYNDWVSHGKSHLRSPEEKATLQDNKLLLCLSVKMDNPDRSDQVFCNLCKTYFSSEEFVRHHKCESKKTECEMCKLTCHSEAGLMLHKYLSHGLCPGQSNEASLADAPSGVNGSLTMWHEDDVANDNCVNRRKCPSCSEIFPVKDLLSHVMNVHTEESPYECCACQTTMASLDQYIDHCEFHLGKKVYGPGSQRCLDCNLRFDTRIHLSRHKVKHQTKCPYCVSEFSSKILLDVHLKNFHTHEMTACSYCKKLFSDLYQLTEHERSHFYSKKSPCATCGALVTNSNMKEHMATWHLKSEYSCSLCGKTFPRRHHLRRHLISHSNNRYECDICKKLFKGPRELHRHAKIHLKNRKFYECQICGKKSSTQSNLKIHMRTHASVKAFTCEHCGKGFNYNQSLQVHIRKNHTAPEESTTTATTTAASSTSSTTSSSSSTASTIISTTLTPSSSIATVGKPAQGSAPLEYFFSTDTIQPTDYPEHPVYPQPSQEVYHDPPGLFPITTFQHNYTNVVNTIVRPRQDSSQETQQQGYPMFYQQF